MNVVAIIPARGGSKRVPRKNLRNLGGRALIAWSIQAAKEAETVSRVIVSTDDEEIANVAQGWGAEVSMRPPELATDASRIEDALLHVFCKETQAAWPDLVVTLQPTSPIRRPGLIDECVRKLVGKPASNSCLTAVEVGVTWWMEWDINPERPFFWVNQFGNRQIPQRQDWQGADDRLAEDGSVFVTRWEHLRRWRNRRALPTTIVVNDRTVDIDTEADLRFAEALLSAREAVPA